MQNTGLTWEKLLWSMLAYSALALGLNAAFLPILPTTPFLLVAVWAGSHTSSKFKWRLLRHPHFGPALRNWYRHGAIAKQAKRAAVSVIGLSRVVIVVSGRHSEVVVLTGILLFCCSAFLLSRPDLAGL